MTWIMVEGSSRGLAYKHEFYSWSSPAEAAHCKFSNNSMTPEFTYGLSPNLVDTEATLSNK